ncbi:MAG: papain-like cysteine protease family protein, partial [Gemmatimonadaceae bacterium]
PAATRTPKRASSGKTTCSKPSTTPVSRSFDTGAPVHCEHNVSYPTVQPVDLPSTGEAPRPRASAMDIQVEAFEDDPDEIEDLTTRLTTRLTTDEDQASSQSLAFSDEDQWLPPTPRNDAQVDTPSAGVEETVLPQSFADQMRAVELDLAQLAERADHPAPNAPTPPSSDERSSATPPQPRSGHGIFDAMAKGMEYATEFRLPSVQVSQVFSALDRQLDAEEAQPEVPDPPATPAPVMPGGDVLLADLARMTPAQSLGMQVGPPAHAFGTAINIRHTVQLVPQATGMSCWAASAAMVVGFRDKVSIDPSEIARATGYWAQYAAGLNAEDTGMFKVWRLAPEAAQSYTVQSFADLLRRHGPLWVASAEPGPHVRVVTGMVGDGTPTGTTVYINDPWEIGMGAFRLPNAGSQYTETFQRFVDKQETLGRQESASQGIYIAHA